MGGRGHEEMKVWEGPEGESGEGQGSPISPHLMVGRQGGTEVGGRWRDPNVVMDVHCACLHNITSQNVCMYRYIT